MSDVSGKGLWDASLRCGPRDRSGLELCRLERIDKASRRGAGAGANRDVVVVVVGRDGPPRGDDAGRMYWCRVDEGECQGDEVMIARSLGWLVTPASHPSRAGVASLGRVGSGGGGFLGLCSSSTSTLYDAMMRKDGAGSVEWTRFGGWDGVVVQVMECGCVVVIVIVDCCLSPSSNLHLRQRGVATWDPTLAPQVSARHCYGYHYCYCSPNRSLDTRTCNGPPSSRGESSASVGKPKALRVKAPVPLLHASPIT